MICFCWSGFPQYAARCIGAFVAEAPDDVLVVATRPRVPVVGMEALCCCSVVWINDGTSEIAQVDVDKISALIVSGWSIPAFNKLATGVKMRGGLVIAMVDNDYRFSWKEVVKAMRFRLRLRHRYDGYLVPGDSARKLLRFYGVPDSRIRSNLYSADESIFHGGEALSDRPKRIIYVGQLCERKNVIMLLDAFYKSGITTEGWKLSYFGCGPQREELLDRIARYHLGRSVTVSDFCQPERLCEEYRAARIFALLSREEHWGLVVHEAALSGCLLLLSDRVGAAADLASDRNAFMVRHDSVDEVSSALRRAASYDEPRLARAEKASISLAAKISLSGFAHSVRSLVSLSGGKSK